MTNQTTASIHNEALASAILRGDLAECRRAIGRGADPNAAVNSGVAGDVMLTYAITCRFKAGVELLLDRGASLSGAPCRRRLPLVCAADVGDLAIAGELIERKVDARAADAAGWTALHHAARLGDVSLIELLQPGVADVHIANNAGETPMHLASRSTYGDPIRSLRMLVAAGGCSSFIPSFPKLDYLTPFQLAVRYGAHDQIDFFLRECGEDEAQLTYSGRKIMEIAPFDSTRELLRAGATARAISAEISDAGDTTSFAVGRSAISAGL
jgi:hypothetical protein